MDLSVQAKVNMFETVFRQPVNKCKNYQLVESAVDWTIKLPDETNLVRSMRFSALRRYKNLALNPLRSGEIPNLLSKKDVTQNWSVPKMQHKFVHHKFCSTKMQHKFDLEKYSELKYAAQIMQHKFVAQICCANKVAQIM